MIDALDKVIKQFREEGLQVDVVDEEKFGEIVRVPELGDKGQKKSGWYVVYEWKIDDKATGEKRTVYPGAFGGYKGNEGGWSKKLSLSSLKLDKEQKKEFKIIAQEAKERKEKEKQAKQNKAAVYAKSYFDKCSAVAEHEYLQRKQVNGYGVKYDDKGNAVVPFRDLNGKIWGLQLISPHKRKEWDDRDKRYFPAGLKKQGSFHLIGSVLVDKPLLFAEGYATAASLHQATGFPVVVVFDAGNILPVAQVFRSRYPHIEIVISADDDHKTTNNKDIHINPGILKAKEAAHAVSGLVIIPKFRDHEKRDDKDSDFNDLHVNEGLAAVTLCVNEQLHKADENWECRLTYTKSGNYTGDPRNVTLVLENHPSWKGIILYNEFSYRVVKGMHPPFFSNKGEWEDTDTTNTVVWLAESYGIMTTNKIVDNVISAVARRNGFHPVRNEIESIQWDGVNRIKGKNWLHTYLGTEDNEYTKLVSEKFLIQMIARVMRPGCKADGVLILEGEQGIGKSTALNILGGDYFSDTHFKMGEKDSLIQMSGIWLIEIGELDSLNKADSALSKQFLVSRKDNYRPAYGRWNQEFLRQVVFAGTTNHDSYLKDPTGNRRYWPVRAAAVHAVDLMALHSDRDQLLAEALQLFKNGDIWHVKPDEARAFSVEQEKRYIGDVWEDEIYIWLNNQTNNFTKSFTASDILEQAFGLMPKDVTRQHEMRLSPILQRLGFKRGREDRKGSRLRVYLNPNYVKKEKQVPDFDDVFEPDNYQSPKSIVVIKSSSTDDIREAFRKKPDEFKFNGKTISAKFDDGRLRTPQVLKKWVDSTRGDPPG